MIKKYSTRFAGITIIITAATFFFYAYSSGINGRTQLNGDGCTCHGGLNPSVTVSIIGPDTLIAGQTAQFTVTVSGGPLAKAGTNIAASDGILSILNGDLQEMGGELTHTSPLAPEGGTVTFLFQFQAPAEAGTVTLYANGNSVNFDGGTSGDEWNYAPNKEITVIKEQHLTVKSYIQGFFNGTTTISDTLRAELRVASSPYAKVASAKTVFNNQGISDFAFTGALNGTQYYLVLRHRNALETWSSQFVVFSNDTASYDYTSLASQAFGDNLIAVSGKYCMFAADVTQDGIVDFTDLALVDNDSYNFAAGYLTTDVNGDDIVDFSDLSIVDNNSLSFVTSAQPSMKRAAAR